MTGFKKIFFKKTGYIFNTTNLLNQAFFHSSWVNENPNNNFISNERLEFLGDAILELIISEYLFQQFNNAKEGTLSKIRSNITNEAELANIALHFNLGKHLLLGKGEINQNGHRKTSILANLIEASVASIYLDSNFKTTKKILITLFAKSINHNIKYTSKYDYKTALQEKTQEILHTIPQYNLTKAKGPAHEKLFIVLCSIKNKTISQGTGNSKKNAEQNAARIALSKLKKIKFL